MKELPAPRRGVVTCSSGPYTVGLPYRSRMASSLVGGIGEDARYVAEHSAAVRSPSTTMSIRP